MPESLYITAALALGVTITFTLRALPFAIKSALRESTLVASLGRSIPLGAVTILAVYCLSATDLQAPDHGLGTLAGTAVTIAIHAWRRNAILSILTGTITFLTIVNTLS